MERQGNNERHVGYSHVGWVPFLVGAVLFGAFIRCSTQPPPIDQSILVADSLSNRWADVQLGSGLIEQLNCGACHEGVPVSQTFQAAPPLTAAGLRYEPGYLFHYLQYPIRIRHHIGHSRMPNFQLSSRESLALTLYLMEQTHDPFTGNVQTVSSTIDTEPLANNPYLGEQSPCQACHILDGKGNLLVSDLSRMGRRLQPEWMKKFILAPHQYTKDPAAMPAFFFREETEGSLTSNSPDSPEQIGSIVAYLQELNQLEKEQQATSYAEARKQYPRITAATGQRIYQQLNCEGCHGLSAGSQTVMGPDLTQEEARVQKNWLVSYLSHPEPIRHFGHPPGTANRMPDFYLSKSEVDSLVVYLTGSSIVADLLPEPLTPFRSKRVGTLLRDRYSCLGCHRLGGEGGHLGPDLSQVSRRLRPEFVSRMVQDPHEAIPGTFMPKSPLMESVKNELILFLLHDQSQPTPLVYPDLTQHDYPVVVGDSLLGKPLYEQKCGPCHGINGDGIGFNSPFLSTKPTDFTDSTYMASRPDDTLFDGIYAGGFILNKSNEMPAWGEQLSTAQIQSLVRYIRVLCRCESPRWTQDDQRPQDL